jgi:coenzyme F420-dependent glucose-6-phosphate dehydrogenase
LRISKKGNNVTLGEGDIADVIICGPDPTRHIEKIRAFAKAGYDHGYVYQVGADQEGFPIL